MRTIKRFLPLGLFLAVGLWACQDQVVTPDIQPSFAKGGKKPPPQQMLVGFLHPDNDPRSEDHRVPNLVVDISADPQLMIAEVDEDDVLFFDADSYHLLLHFQDDLDRTDFPEGVVWCESERCARGSGCDPAEGFNLLQDLQDLSDKLDGSGVPIGLTGKLSGSSGSWGIWFDVIVGEGDVIDAGRYQLDTWNVFGNQGEYPDGFYSDGNDLTGYRWWRSRNTPVRVFKWAAGAKKNDLYTHKTTCGYFEPGSEYRRATHEVFAKPAGE